MRKLSWKPRRRGNIYCAPACGASCTWKKYQDTIHRGKVMRNSMRYPKQWRVCVSENLGWWVCLEHIAAKGLLTVHVGYTRYFAMLSLDTPHAGDCDWTDCRHFSTPQAAVDHVVRLANRVMAKKIAAMRKVQSALKENA